MGENLTVQEALASSSATVHSGSFNAAQREYTRRSIQYDKEHELLGASGHQVASSLCMKYITNSDDTAVLDVCTGTGNVMLHLRNNEKFVGEIDILDANMDMLYMASKKNLKLRNIFRHIIKASGDLPVAPDGYDAITCVECFCLYHLPPSSFSHIFSSLRVSGVLIVNTRVDERSHYNQELEEVISRLLEDGTMVVVEKKEIVTFHNELLSMPTCFRVFRKL